MSEGKVSRMTGHPDGSSEDEFSLQELNGFSLQELNCDVAESA
jgi:hypothetical protein